MLHKLKSACFIRKKPTLNKCVFKCFAKVAVLTVRSLNSTGNSFQQLGPASAKALKSQTPIRPVARHNKIPTNSGSQSRPTRDCQTLGAKSNKVSRSETFLDTWTLACRLYIWHAAGKEANQSRQVICDQNASNLESDRMQKTAEFNTDCNNCKRDQG